MLKLKYKLQTDIPRAKNTTVILKFKYDLKTVIFTAKSTAIILKFKYKFTLAPLGIMGA